MFVYSQVALRQAAPTQPLRRAWTKADELQEPPSIHSTRAREAWVRRKIREATGVNVGEARIRAAWATKKSRAEQATSVGLTTQHFIQEGKRLGLPKRSWERDSTTGKCKRAGK